MLDKSFPSPKQLASTFREVLPPPEHQLEIWFKLNLPIDELLEYTHQFNNELQDIVDKSKT